MLFSSRLVVVFSGVKPMCHIFKYRFVVGLFIDYRYMNWKLQICCSSYQKNVNWKGPPPVS
jgi:hypothetical protein